MNKKIFYSEIVNKFNLAKVAKFFLNVKKHGNGYVSLCPFHKENYPSFFINNISYKCFGCGAKGNIISFLSKIMKKSYFSIIEYLVRKKKVIYGNDIPEVIKIPEYIKKGIRLKFVLNTVNKFFKHNLLNYPNNICLKYLIKYRNISLKSLETYELGYSGLHSYKFFNFLIKNNILFQEAKELGLLAYKKNWLFPFVNRIVFPIKNFKGEIISFTTRQIFSGDSKSPKYLNCNNSILYNKNKTFFGIHKFFHEGIKNIFIVEGIFDAIAIYETGHFGLSIGGSSLSSFHIKILKRSFLNITICLDNDKVGRRKSIILLKKLLVFDIVPMFLAAPFKDFGDTLSKNKLSILEKKLKMPIDFINSIMDFICRADSQNFKFRVRCIQNLSKLIQSIKNTCIQGIYNTKMNTLFEKSTSYYHLKCLTKNKYSNKIKHMDKLILLIIKANTMLLKDREFLSMIVNFASVSLKKYLIRYSKTFLSNSFKYKAQEVKIISQVNKEWIIFSNIINGHIYVDYNNKNIIMSDLKNFIIRNKKLKFISSISKILLN